MTSDIDNVLEVEDLRVYFYTDEGTARAVDGVSFSVRRGSLVAIVGESGCGKTVTAYSILRLIQDPGRIVDGSIRLARQDKPVVDIVGLDDDSEELYDLRGGAVSMIFQEPMTALSPVHTIGDQISEGVLLHQDVTEDEARQRAIDMLAKVGIPGPETRVDQYPHELSGGMRQRAMIAMALVCNPELLIADEPTTALDVTIQAQILKLLRTLQQEMNTSVLLITHDLGVVAQTADEVAVMYLGRVVEQADVRSVLKHPKHPYTMALLQSLPGLSENDGRRLASIEGSVPSVTRIPPGCAFHTRCPHAEPGRCDVGDPPELETAEPGHDVACFRWQTIQKQAR
jgi:peptide/nickel transport system ATP-binding protein